MKFLSGIVGVMLAFFALTMPARSDTITTVMTDETPEIIPVHGFHLDCRYGVYGPHQHVLIFGRVPCYGARPHWPRRPGWWRHHHRRDHVRPHRPHRPGHHGHRPRGPGHKPGGHHKH